MGKGILIGNSDTGEPSMLHHEQTISGEEMHTLIIFSVSVMALVDGLLINLYYNPLIDYTKSHVCLCMFHLYIVRLPVYVTCY